jgi:anti-sigma B factor antagonist
MRVGLEVYQEGSEDRAVFRVVGDVDLSTAPLLRDRLQEITTNTKSVVIDLSEVAFLDSTGLSVLVATWNRFCATEDHGSFRLVVSRRSIQRVFDVTGLSDVFEVFPTLEEAIKG